MKEHAKIEFGLGIADFDRQKINICLKLEKRKTKRHEISVLARMFQKIEETVMKILISSKPAIKQKLQSFGNNLISNKYCPRLSNHNDLMD